MLADPIFHFDELNNNNNNTNPNTNNNSQNGLNKSSSNSGYLNNNTSMTQQQQSSQNRIIPPMRSSLKRPSKLELKMNLNEEQTASTPLAIRNSAIFTNSSNQCSPANQVFLLYSL
jgi:hypothetical protein